MHTNYTLENLIGLDFHLPIILPTYVYSKQAYHCPNCESILLNSFSDQPGPAILTYTVEYQNGTKYKDKVVKGSTVFLKCELESLGRPEVTKYHWYAGSQELLKDSQNNTLALTNVGAKDKLTNYSCNAENAAGFGANSSISINVLGECLFYIPRIILQSAIVWWSEKRKMSHFLRL